VNERIRVREVRIIDEDGNQLGVIPTPTALQMARDRSVDLVEVSPNSVPPVCRMLDYGKFKYEQTKKDSEAKKHQHLTELKEVRLRPKIGEHDFDTKLKRAQRFLDEGDKVKVTVQFRGREMAHPKIGHDLLTKFAELLKDHAKVERAPMAEGRTMHLILARGRDMPARPDRPEGADQAVSAAT
jgi:translation initiation factor IF-3